jgi:hypothetical protein
MVKEQKTARFSIPLGEVKKMHLVQCLTQMVDYGVIDPVEEGEESGFKWI